VTGSLLCGSAVLIPLIGLLCEYGFDGGWPSVFYVFGLSSTVVARSCHIASCYCYLPLFWFIMC